jgi:PPOX class probable F420-dependent enzyme
MVARKSAIMPDAIAQFDKAKYFSLETFRRAGTGVRTPVWFARDPASSDALTRFYVYTLPDSGKVKRIRNNPKVRIAPCNMRGDLRGAWVDATARTCDADEMAKGQSLLIQKYGLVKRIGDFFSGLRGRTQVVLAIEIG